MSYSQNDEEQFIAEFFNNKTGRFLDIGAYDGKSLSNTRKLLEGGWSGVLVEPKGGNFEMLMAACRQFADRTVLIQAAVSDQNGLSRFWIDEDVDRLWSTTINRSLLDSGSIREPSPLTVMVPCITMEQLTPFGPYEFLSLDAEWLDFRILKSNSRDLWRQFELICIEPSGLPERADMTKHFIEIGFKVVHETPENLLVARQL